MSVLPKSLAHRLLLAFALLVLAGCAGARPTVTGEQIAPPTAVVENNFDDLDDFDGFDDLDGFDDEFDEFDEFDDEFDVGSDSNLPPGEVERLDLQVIETYPHDPAAFTQGLELIDDGLLLESTGRRGQSTLRLVDPTTGDVQASVDLDDEIWAEGATEVGSEYVQLSWLSGTVFYWDSATLELNRTASYEGEGWGLCYDGTRLIMSDGSAFLTFRDPATFEEISRVRVTRGGFELDSINELECVDDQVWANIFTTDQIVRIDPSTGAVNAVVDAASLEQPRLADINAVLNGIAYDADTSTFLVTGKNWSNMYRVAFVSPEA